MRERIITITAVLAAVVGWWGLYELTGKVTPDRPGVLSFFFVLLFLAVTTTLIPPAAYLNRRFAPQATERDGWRFLRHSAWGGLCALAWAWLQMNRALNPGFVVISLLMCIALEVLIVRMRNET